MPSKLFFINWKIISRAVGGVITEGNAQIWAILCAANCPALFLSIPISLSAPIVLIGGELLLIRQAVIGSNPIRGIPEILGGAVAQL